MGAERTGEAAPGATPDAVDGTLRLLVGWMALAVIYAWLQRTALAPLPGDEGIYLFAGQLVSEGLLPYRDFFLAHPPLRVLLFGVLFALGASAWVIKAFLLSLGALTGLLVGLVVLPARGVLTALASVFFYLFATLSLDLGGVAMGSDVAACLLAGSLLALTRERAFLAGVLLSLAGLQAFYALIPLPLLAWWAWRSERLSRFAAGLCVLVFALLGLLAWFGPDFLQQTFQYHVQKVTHAESAYPWHKLARFAKSEAGLLAFSLAAFLDATPTARRVGAIAMFSVGVTAAYGSFMSHYMVVALPFLAVASALGIAALVARGRERALPGWALAAAVAVVITLTHLPHVLYGLDLDGQRRMERRETLALEDAVNRNRPPSGLLWGDSALVPLIALETGLRVAGNMVDTNAKRFRTGQTDPDETLSRIFEGPSPGVLLLEQHGVARIPALREYVESHLPKRFTMVAPTLGYTVDYYLDGPPAK